MINNFKGPNDWASNFSVLQNPIMVGNLIFKTNEHFFAAHKTLIYEERVWIANQPTAREAKWAGSQKGYKGRKITLRNDWQPAVQINVMKLGLTLKFILNYDMATKLINSWPKILIEGNWWHDNFWGDCYCKKCENIEGQNNLGIQLMKLRTLLMKIRI